MFETPGSVIASSFGRSEKPDTEIVLARIGYKAREAAPCCYTQSWTYSQLISTLAAIRHDVGGRSIVITDVAGIDPSGIYFLADLTTGTALTESIISTLVATDIDRNR
jgi:hypothetical protein